MPTETNRSAPGSQKLQSYYQPAERQRALNVQSQNGGRFDKISDFNETVATDYSELDRRCTAHENGVGICHAACG